MDENFKHDFLEKWNRYFSGAELPIGFYYTDEERSVKPVPAAAAWRCLIEDLNAVRDGESLCFSGNSIGCGGGKRYLGFEQKLRPNFEYFLSYGIPGELEGERYKKTPGLVQEHLKHQQPFRAPKRFIVFKRWDQFEPPDHPQVIIFFATPDVLSGLFTLANYDQPSPYGVSAPFGSGCSSIVYYPSHEQNSKNAQAILGMFDVSARPCLPQQTLTFAVPWKRFVEMVRNMEESFLITESWNKIRERIAAESFGTTITED